MIKKLFYRIKVYLLEIMLILCLAVGWYFFHSIDTSVHYPAQIVTKVNTVPVSRTDAAAHDQILLNIIAEQGSSSLNILSAYENAKNQARGFYSVIIAALLTVMFIGQTGKRGTVAAAALLVIVSTYWLDVSFDDLSNRQVAENHALGCAQKRLFVLQPFDSTWYTLDYSVLDSLAKEARAPSKMRCRKIALASHPNIEQAVYYLIPFILFLVCRCWINTVHFRLKRRLTSISK